MKADTARNFRRPRSDNAMEEVLEEHGYDIDEIESVIEA